METKLREAREQLAKAEGELETTRKAGKEEQERLLQEIKNANRELKQRDKELSAIKG
jgi:hypothetical protein